MTHENIQDARRKQIVIIGAGPAGLTSGIQILKTDSQSFDVVIVEASKDIGGISRTVEVQGNRMDIGGHRFFSKDQLIMDWWSDMLPLQGAPAFDDKTLDRPSEISKGGPDPDETDDVMLYRTRVSRIFYGGEFYDYPLKMSANMLSKLGFFRSLSVGFSYLASCIHKRPETSLENFYINRFGRKLYSMFFEGYTEKVWGRHPNSISADWGAQRVKGLNIMALIKDLLRPKKKAADTETSLIKSFWYPKHGPGQLWEAAARRFCDLGGTIRYSTCAQSFEYDEAGCITAVICADEAGARVSLPCDEVISTMPLKDLARTIGNRMPQRQHQIAEGLPYRDFVTVGLLVKKLSIKNETDTPTLGNIVPDDWIYVQDDSVKLGRLQIFNNWSPYMVQDPQNSVWLGLEYFCNEGDEFWNMPQDECIKLAQEELVRIGVLEEGAPIMLSHREHVKKAYPAYFDTYAEIGELRDWLKLQENLYCVGRNGQHRYNNMDHSMLTALYAAAAITDGSMTQDDIWAVNTETSYHEEENQSHVEEQSQDDAYARQCAEQSAATV